MSSMINTNQEYQKIKFSILIALRFTIQIIELLKSYRIINANEPRKLGRIPLIN